jgi:hypothetical protein
MTQLDSEGLPTAILERAREALSPRDADQARVLSALEQRLGLPPHVSHLPDNNPQPERSNSGELGGATMKMLEAKRFGLFNMSMPRWAASALIPLAGVAAISIFVANRSSHPQAAVPKRQATRPAAAAVTETSLPDALDLALAQAEIKTPKPAERPVDAAPADKKPPRKKCRAANGVERPCAPTTKPTPTAVASASPPPAASLSKELAALREAQQALRKGQPTQALEVLTRFEHEAPGPGAMQEERFAAATMARCALSAATGSELYTQFTQRYPNSAYSARVRRLCLPKQ